MCPHIKYILVTIKEGYFPWDRVSVKVIVSAEHYSSLSLNDFTSTTQDLNEACEEPVGVL